jgi:hypothetical protein
MKKFSGVVYLAFTLAAFGQIPTSAEGGQRHPKPLTARIDHFDITDAILRDSLSVLSLKKVDGLHLGFEELLRKSIQDDPWSLNTRFTLHLANKNLREILDAICLSDIRYTWAEDGDSINIYPRDAANDSTYLLNLWIDKIRVVTIPDPDQALTPLSKLFPAQQVGYAGFSLGDNSYARAWTEDFQRLTVRQYINRIAEHMGSETSWVWQGGTNERMFTFVKRGFSSEPRKTSLQSNQ